MVISLAVLVLDLMLPLGVAAGVPHVAPVLLGFWFSDRRHIPVIAVIAGSLVIVGYVLSPDGGETWKVLINRTIALFAIVVAAGFVFVTRRRAEIGAGGSVGPAHRRDQQSNVPTEQGLTNFGARGLLALFPAVLLIVAADVWINKKTEEARLWVTHTYEVQVGLGDILSTLQDAETGQRGFLLTGDEAYLAPFEQASLRLDATLERVRSMTADNPDQQERLRLATPLVAEKMAELNQTISLWRRGQKEDALALVGTDLGQQIMDQLRVIFTVMADEEDRLLLARERTLERNRDLALIADTISILLIFLIGGIVILRMRRLLLIRERAQEDLTEARSMLETRIAERTRDLNKLSQAIAQSPNIIFLTDTEGNIEYANRRFYEVTGYTPVEVIGRTPRIIKSGNTPKEVYADLWGTITKGRVWRGEIEDRCKDGETFWAEITIAPIFSETGEITNYFSSHENIAMRRDAEKKMVEATEQALLASRAKSDLIANMSHELRTPLNAIIGFADAIKLETFGPIGNDMYRSYLDDIHQSGEHLLALINDILDVSAIEMGGLELNEEDVDIHDVVNAAVRLVRPRADQGQITLTIAENANLPVIHADERRVKQVVLNLVSNAVKFTPEGGEVIVSGWIQPDGSLALTVSDTGIGMSEEEIEQAMSNFGQLDSGLDRKHEGTGLGLPLTKGLMELHGGSLKLDSRKDHGTMVQAIFPAERLLRQAG